MKWRLQAEHCVRPSKHIQNRQALYAAVVGCLRCKQFDNSFMRSAAHLFLQLLINEVIVSFLVYFFHTIFRSFIRSVFISVFKPSFPLFFLLIYFRSSSFFLLLLICCLRLEYNNYLPYYNYGLSSLLLNSPYLLACLNQFYSRSETLSRRRTRLSYRATIGAHQYLYLPIFLSAAVHHQTSICHQVSSVFFSQRRRNEWFASFPLSLVYSKSKIARSMIGLSHGCGISSF